MFGGRTNITTYGARARSHRWRVRTQPCERVPLMTAARPCNGTHHVRAEPWVVLRSSDYSRSDGGTVESSRSNSGCTAGTGTPRFRNRSKVAVAVRRNIDHSGRSTATSHASCAPPLRAALATRARPTRLRGRGRGRQDPGAVPVRPQARGDRCRPHPARRGHCVDRSAGQDPRRGAAVGLDGDHEPDRPGPAADGGFGRRAAVLTGTQGPVEVEPSPLGLAVPVPVSVPVDGETVGVPVSVGDGVGDGVGDVVGAELLPVGIGTGVRV